VSDLGEEEMEMAWTLVAKQRRRIILCSSMALALRLGACVRYLCTQAPLVVSGINQSQRAILLLIISCEV
jgi:hypothetical protein